MQEDFTTAQSSYQLALGEEEGEKGPKRRLPSSVTVPKRGPLALKTAACQYLPDKTATSSQKHKVFTSPKCHHRPKHSLTQWSFPLRPLEQIEGELGELSCAQLRDSLELMTSHCSHHTTLPLLHPLMKHSPLHTPPILEQYTHHDQGPMDISITYSRHMAPVLKETHVHTRGHTFPLTVCRPPSERRQPSSGQVWDTERGRVSSPTRRHTSGPVVSQCSHKIYTARPGIAPPGVVAVTLHRLKPITATTVVRGKRISALPQVSH